jgi:hypothetical protein
MDPGRSRTRSAGVTLALALLASAGCGSGDGGDGGQDTPNAPARLEGQAAADVAWGSAEVALDCIDGSSPRTLAASDGRYALTVEAQALPCLVRATSLQGDRLWSVATTTGTVNVTPGSDWTVTRALRLSTSGLRPDRSMLRMLTPAAVAQAQADVRRALGASGLVAEGDLIAAAAGPAADALRASQRQVQAALASRDIDPLSLRHSLALREDMSALSDALKQGRLADALNLPTHRSDAESMPQLASGLVSLLTGPADTMFAVNVEGGWRSTDGGHQWAYVNRALTQVVRFRGRLWARDLGGPVVSDDAGRTWSVPAGAPAGCRFSNDSLVATPGGRLWFFPDSGCPGRRDHFSDDGVRWQSQAWDNGTTHLNVMQEVGLAQRQPPQRQVFLPAGERERVVSCLLGSCVETQVLDWPSVHWLMPVEGSDEIAAGLTSNASGRPASLAFGSDGIRWQAMTYLSFNSLYRTPQGDLLASPGANAVGGVNRRIQRSTDDGRTWLPSDPAVNAADGWLTLGADTRLRRSARASSGLQLSVDAGRNWTDLPQLSTEVERRSWRRAPDGLLLRDTDHAVQASRDEGASWQDVLPHTDGARARLGMLWLDGRWVVPKPPRLWTSADGLRWADSPLGLAGTPWEGWSEGALVSDDGVWVMQVSRSSTPHNPTLRALLESKDQGRTWAPSARHDALASTCGTMRYMLRPRAGDAVPAWHMRTETDLEWRELALPPVTAGTSETALDCERGLLRITVNGEPSYVRGPYGNLPSGARGLSHWLSPDHGKHWFPVGRPGTDLFRVQNRWWSLGLDSVMLWP